MKYRLKMKSKSKLGQFYTTNYEYILQSFTIPPNIPIIEPFAGNADLLQFSKDTDRQVECYDIDPKKDFIVRRDTLMNPPSFSGKFVLTNPPYLARNKNTSKEIYDKYGCNDLYKCFMEILIQDVCQGGILIVPLNFISSMRSSDIDLRKRFLDVYSITHMNIFEEQVFNDTSYNVCSFQFTRKLQHAHIQCCVYPAKIHLSIEFNAKNNYTIGGEIYNLPASNTYKIDRATKNTTNTGCITNILVKCIDDSANSPICLKMVADNEKYVDTTPNLSARSYATLVIEPAISIEEQTLLVNCFNVYLNEAREKYHSLFLTNYRENNRKRISFQLVFQICDYILSQSSN